MSSGYNLFAFGEKKTATDVIDSPVLTNLMDSMIQSPKFILTIAWNLSGFHVFDVFPKEKQFHACATCLPYLIRSWLGARRDRPETPQF
jgi:hypothetical protein